MRNKLCLISFCLVFASIVKSQSCQFLLKCDNETTFLSQELLMTKSLPQKDPQSETDQPSVKAISKMRRRTSKNKKVIAGNKKIVEEFKNINRLNLKTVKSRLRKQMKINADVNKKVQHLYNCQVNGFRKSPQNVPFVMEDGTNFTLSCEMYFLPDGNATRWCIKGHIYPDFITHPLACKRAQLTWKRAKEHCQHFNKVLMEGPQGYETEEKRGQFCKELGLDGYVWEKEILYRGTHSFGCQDGVSYGSGFQRRYFNQDYFFCRDF